MRILVVGSSGGMGKRYVAILRYLGHEPIEYDTCNGASMEEFDALTVKHGAAIEAERIIIATPTDTHYELVKYYSQFGKPILCEKPISKNLAEVEEIRELSKTVDIRMVCNYAFIVANKRLFHPQEIEYDHYNTGRDGFWWDCIQLVYLCRDIFSLRHEHPIFQLRIGNAARTLQDVAASYVRMVERWIFRPADLWGMDIAVEATKRVMEAEKCGL